MAVSGQWMPLTGYVDGLTLWCLYIWKSPFFLHVDNIIKLARSNKRYICKHRRPRLSCATIWFSHQTAYNLYCSSIWCKIFKWTMKVLVGLNLICPRTSWMPRLKISLLLKQSINFVKTRAFESKVHIQSNFNGSNIIGTTENCSRHE